METALFRLLGEKVHVSGVGRTDSVFMQDVMSRASRPSAAPFRQTGFPLRSTAFCRPISRSQAQPKSRRTFDARFDCTRKRIRLLYLSVHAARSFSCAIRVPLQLSARCRTDARGRKRFVGTHDFASVRSQGTPVKKHCPHDLLVTWTRLMISSVSAYARRLSAGQHGSRHFGHPCLCRRRQAAA